MAQPGAKNKGLFGIFGNRKKKSDALDVDDGDGSDGDITERRDSDDTMLSAASSPRAPHIVKSASKIRFFQSKNEDGSALSSETTLPSGATNDSDLNYGRMNPLSPLDEDETPGEDNEMKDIVNKIRADVESVFATVSVLPGFWQQQNGTAIIIDQISGEQDSTPGAQRQAPRELVHL
jgi:hypothetical protein